jgi:DNA primase
MKLQDIAIQEVASLLSVQTKGNRFKHACRSHEVEGHANGYSAAFYPDDSFYCFRCGTYGRQLELIQHHLGVDTESEAMAWAMEYLGVEGQETYYAKSCQYKDTLQSIYTASVMALQTHEEALSFLNNTYGFTREDAEKYQLGVVTDEVLSPYPSSLLHEYGFHTLVQRILIPIVHEELGLVGLKARSIEVERVKQGSTPKYVNISHTDKYPLPLYNGVGARNHLKKENQTTVLIICESEMDVLALRKSAGITTAVAVSSATSHTLEQKQQLSRLAKHASATVVLFDTDRAGKQGSDKLCKALLDLGVDPKVYALPNEGTDKLDIGMYLKSPEHVSVFQQTLTELVFAGRTYLQEYIENHRQDLVKEHDAREMTRWVASLPTHVRKGYIDQLATVPKGERYDNLAKEVKNKYRLEPKRTTELISQHLKEKAKVTKANLVLADTDTADEVHYYAQDYWFDIESDTLMARKTIWTEVKQSDGEQQTIQRVPICIDVSSPRSGEVSVDFTPVDVDSLDTRRLSVMLPDDDLTDQPAWQVVGKTRYSFRSFYQSRGRVDVDAASLFQDIRQVFLDYLYFKDESYATTVTCYIMLSYVYMLFETVPYMHIKGEAGSGKSLLVDVMQQLSFNADKLVGANAPHIYRLVHSKRGVLFMGEEEHLSDTKNQRNVDMLGIIKDSYAKTGGMVPRFEEVKGANYKITRFNAYGQVVFSGTKPIEYILATRCINIRTSKVPVERAKDIKDYTSDRLLLKARFQELRNKLMVWSLTQFRLAHESYLQAKLVLRDKGVQNRDLDVWTPMLAMCLACQQEQEGQAMIENTILKEIGTRESAIKHSDAAEVIQLLLGILEEFKNTHEPQAVGKNEPCWLQYGLFRGRNGAVYAVKSSFQPAVAQALFAMNNQNRYIDQPNAVRSGKWLSLLENSEILKKDTYGREVPLLGYKRQNKCFRIDEVALEAKRHAYYIQDDSGVSDGGEPAPA